MIYYFVYNESTGYFEGFKCREVHGDNIPKNSLPINEELWEKLQVGYYGVNMEEILNYKPYKDVDEVQVENVLTLEDLNTYFQEVQPDKEHDRKPQVTPSLDDRIKVLEGMVLNTL